jgi:hypothetical protein
MQVVDFQRIHQTAFFVGNVLKPLISVGLAAIWTHCPQSYPQKTGMVAESVTNQ